jgi:hypothetical protein
MLSAILNDFLCTGVCGFDAGCIFLRVDHIAVAPFFGALILVLTSKLSIRVADVLLRRSLGTPRMI